MTKFGLYNIPLVNVTADVQNFSYELGEDFFRAIDGDEVKRGDVKVDVTLQKTASAFDFSFSIDGVVIVPCTRCLDAMEQKIESENHLTVKLGEEYSDEGDDVIIIPKDDGAINIAWFLYEFIALNIPINHYHEEGKCNKTMQAKLRKYKVLDDDEYWEDDKQESDDDDKLEEDDVIDPRWEALKSINFDEE